MELSQTRWDAENKTLSWTADRVGGETMDITLAVPSGAAYRAVAVRSETARVSFRQTGQYVTVSAGSKTNQTSDIEIAFNPMTHKP